LEREQTRPQDGRGSWGEVEKPGGRPDPFGIASFLRKGREGGEDLQGRPIQFKERIKKRTFPLLKRTRKVKEEIKGSSSNGRSSVEHWKM